MKIGKRERNGVTILDLEGKLIFEDGAGLLRDVVRQSLPGGPYNVVANLSGLTGMDSSGIGALVAAFTALQERGGALKILHLPERFLTGFKTTQINTVFEIFEDEDTAVESFH